MLLKLLLVLACAVGAQARSSKGISDKKLEDIETEWMKEESLDEALSELPRSQTAGKEPNQIIREYMDRHHSPPAMMFIEVDYPNCCTQKKTQDVVSKWDAMLLSTGMVVSMYPVAGGRHATQNAQRNARLFLDNCFAPVPSQPECVSVQWNDHRFPGPGETDEQKARKAARTGAQNKKDAGKDNTASGKEQREGTQKQKRGRKTKTKNEKSAANVNKDEV
eukprot:scaffold186161_cov34-Tisochrysis_lutea.AAC.1